MVVCPTWQDCNVKGLDVMTEKQIMWAASHDWFTSVTNDGLGVIVADVSVDTKTGQTFTEARRFDDYHKLRQWAGY